MIIDLWLGVSIIVGDILCPVSAKLSFTVRWNGLCGFESAFEWQMRSMTDLTSEEMMALSYIRRVYKKPVEWYYVPSPLSGRSNHFRWMMDPPPPPPPSTPPLGPARPGGGILASCLWLLSCRGLFSCCCPPLFEPGPHHP